MTITIADQKYETIAVTRNSRYIEGLCSIPFSVTLVFGDFKREYEAGSFDDACNLARRISEDYHVNYILEQGIDPEYDAYWYTD